MRRILPILLAALVAFAFGVGVGVLLGGEPATRSAESVDEAEPEAAEDHAAESADRPQSRRAQRPAERAGRRPTFDPEDLVGGAGATGGEGRITGTVQTANGGAVPGVTIWAERVEDDAGAGLLGETEGPSDDPAAYFERMSAEIARRFQSRRRATTGADGAYAVEGLGDGDYEVKAFLEGWELQPDEHDVAAHAAAGAIVDFRAARAAAVGVAVRLPDGGAPERARLKFKGLGGTESRSVRWTPGGSTVRVPAGRYRVSATAGRDDELRSEELEVELGDDGSESLTLQLAGRAGVRGTVELPKGEEEIENVHVFLLRYVSSEPPSAERLREDGDEVHLWGEGGFRYAFHDLQPGKYLLGATRGTARIPIVETVFVGGSMETRDLKLPPLDRREYVVLRVLGPDGEPIPPDDLSLGTGFSTEGYGSTSRGGSAALTRPDGSLWVFHHDAPLDRRDNEDTEWYLIVESEQHGERRVRYDRRGDAPEVTIKFEHPATLTVDVTNAVGNAVRDELRIDVVPLADDDLHGSAISDKAVETDGRVAFDAILPGTYTLKLMLNEGGRKRELATKKIDLVSGENAATLALPELFALRVSAADAAGATVWVQRKLRVEGNTTHWDWHASRSLDESGEVRFVNLPAGDYMVTLRRGDEDSRKKEVTIPGPAEVRF